MTRQENARSKKTAKSAAQPPITAETATVDSSVPSQSPARPKSPRLPIELIAMIAEILLQDGEVGWTAVATMSRICRDWELGTLPFLLRDVDVTEHNRHRINKFLELPVGAILSYLRSIKLDFRGGKKSVSLQHSFLQKAGPYLRKLSITFQDGTVGERTAAIFNSVISDKLESLEVIYLPAYGKSVRDSTLPKNLAIPTTLKHVAFQFKPCGPQANGKYSIEKQIWQVVGNLDKLEDWSLTIEPGMMQVAVEGFPVSKAPLLSEISSTAYEIKCFLQKLPQVAPKSLHLWDPRDSTFRPSLDLGYVATMASLTRLTIERAGLSLPVFRSLPPNLEELYLLEADIAGFFWGYPVNGSRQGIVESLSTLANFRLLFFKTLSRTTGYGVRLTGEEKQEAIDEQVAFWKSVEAPFKIVIEDR